MKTKNLFKKTLPDILPVRASRKTILVKEHEKVKAATKNKIQFSRAPHDTTIVRPHRTVFELGGYPGNWILQAKVA